MSPSLLERMWVKSDGLFITTSSSSHHKMFNKTIQSFSKATLDYVSVDLRLQKQSQEWKVATWLTILWLSVSLATTFVAV